MGNCASAFLITQSAKALVNMGVQPEAIGHLSKELQDPLHLVSETLIKPAYHFLDGVEKKAGLEAKGIDLIKPDQYHKPLQGLTGKAAPNNLGALKGRILTYTLLGVGMVVCTTKLLIDTLSKGLETGMEGLENSLDQISESMGMGSNDSDVAYEMIDNQNMFDKTPTNNAPIPAANKNSFTKLRRR
jgi:hypothetical protein